jgi:hypothetical protein
MGRSRSKTKPLSSFPQETTNEEEGSGQIEIIANTLLGVPKNDYGEHYQAHLLDQYKTYLELTDKISERRSAANTFFLTVNTGLLSAFGIANFVEQKTSPVVFIVGAVAAILLSYSWYRLIRSYRDLNTAKFKVVHEIEKHLPVRPYDAEWEALGRGENRKLYWPFTHIENHVPWIFILVYLAVLSYSIYWLIKGKA